MNTWTCDSCGRSIESVKDGWVEYLTRKDESSGDRIGRGLRLVHHAPAARLLGLRCQYDQQVEYSRDKSIVHDLPLSELLGADGLMWLLSFIAVQSAPANEVIEMIKRLHIPGYEQARPHFESAISAGDIEPNLPEGFYWQSNIKATIAHAKIRQKLLG